MTDIKKLFGVDQETIDKSKDIKPVLDLGSLDLNSVVKVEFTEKEPKEIETPNSKYNKVSKVISVKDITHGENLEYSLFLSAKSLSLGIARIYQKHGNDLTGVKVLIKKTKTIYKDYGENIAYNIQEIPEQEKVSENA